MRVGKRVQVIHRHMVLGLEQGVNVTWSEGRGLNSTCMYKGL